jgi:hypothetical protein
MTPEEKLELLRRFAPTLHFDAMERWRPSLVDEYLAHSAVRDGKDQQLPGTPPAEAAMIVNDDDLKARLSPLKDEPGLDTQLRSNEMLRMYGSGQDLSSGGNAYGRVKPSEDGAFLQYWLFYPDNPCVLEAGRHDGDWELVQVRVKRGAAGLEATEVTLAEHGRPVTQAVEANQANGGPDVFVAVDSHACYFQPGAHPMIPLSDVCQPIGAAGAKPTVLRLPTAAEDEDWVHWSGRWGMDRGFGTRVALRLRLTRTPSILRRVNIGAGESPPSPAHQKGSWPSPKTFAANGTVRKWTAVALRRFTHFLGRLTWPRTPPTVTIEGASEGRYTIEATATGYLARRVTLVSVAFDDLAPDGTRRALAMHSVRAGRRSKPFDIPHAGELVWRAAGYNRLRQRGEPIDGQPQ